VTTETEPYHAVRLVADRTATGTLHVGGADLSAAVSGVELTLNTGGHERGVAMTLHMAAPSVDFDGEARVMIPDSTRAALVALGWTPPAD